MWEWLSKFFATLWSWLSRFFSTAWSWLSVILDIALVLLVLNYIVAGVISLSLTRVRSTHKIYNNWGSRSLFQPFVAWWAVYRFPCSEGAHWYSFTRLLGYMSLFYLGLNIIECLVWSFRHTQMINSFDDGTYYDHFPDEQNEEEEDDEMRRVPGRMGSCEWGLLVHLAFLAWLVMS